MNTDQKILIICQEKDLLNIKAQFLILAPNNKISYATDRSQAQKLIPMVNRVVIFGFKIPYSSQKTSSHNAHNSIILGAQATVNNKQHIIVNNRTIFQVALVTDHMELTDPLLSFEEPSIEGIISILDLFLSSQMTVLAKHNNSHEAEIISLAWNVLEEII